MAIQKACDYGCCKVELTPDSDTDGFKLKLEGGLECYLLRSVARNLRDALLEALPTARSSPFPITLGGPGINVELMRDGELEAGFVRLLVPGGRAVYLSKPLAKRIAAVVQVDTDHFNNQVNFKGFPPFKRPEIRISCFKGETIDDLIDDVAEAIYGPLDADFQEVSRLITKAVGMFRTRPERLANKE